MSSQPPAAPPPEKASGRRVSVIVAIMAIGILVAVGRLLWRSYYFEETDNAYVTGHITLVAPRVDGVVTKVMVVDNQVVKEGDLVVELDPTDYSVRVDRVTAQLRELDAEVSRIDAQIEQGKAEATSAKATVVRARAQASRARLEADRHTSLFARDAKAISRADVDAAVAARESADADLAAHEAQVVAAQAKITAASSARVASHARKDVLAAELKDARHQLGYATLRAPVSGRIGKKAVEIGARVHAGQNLLAIVQDGMWVVANFKEVQLHDLHPGQKASVRFDAFPGTELAGRIDSFSPASGAQFALLPPDNATGNFTKIVQRVPVKITFGKDALGSLANRIVPGMSAVVEVDLRQGKPTGS